MKHDRWYIGSKGKNPVTMDILLNRLHLFMAAITICKKSKDMV